MIHLQCRHQTGRDGGVVYCGLDLFGGRPHVGVCLRTCPVRDREDHKAILVEGIYTASPQVAQSLGRKTCRKRSRS
jgi:hypothetical protein